MRLPGKAICANLIYMFGIGFPELIIILIVALLVVGPSKLPEVARSIGKALGEFRRMADDVKESLTAEMDKEDEVKEEQKAQVVEEKADHPTPDPYAAHPDSAAPDEAIAAEHHDTNPAPPKEDKPDSQKGA